MKEASKKVVLQCNTDDNNTSTDHHKTTITDTTENNNNNDTENDTVTNDNDTEYNDIMMQMAATSSAALMGENIIDSPNTRNMKHRFYKLQHHSSLLSFKQQQEQQVDGTTNASSSSNNNAFVDVYVPDLSINSKKKDTKQTPQATSLTTTNANTNTSSSSSYGLSVGIVAQGLSWAKLQKNRRQRLYLQHLAEQQLYKLQVAQQQQNEQLQHENNDTEEVVGVEQNDSMHRNDTASTTCSSRSFFDFTTFQNFIRLTSPFMIPNDTSTSSSSIQQPNNESNNDLVDRNSNNNTYPTTMTMSSISSTIDDDENDIDTALSKYTNFCSISQSGVGYSVELPKIIQNPSSMNHTNHNYNHKEKSKTNPNERDNQNNHNINDDDDDDENDTSWIPPVRVEDLISSSSTPSTDNKDNVGQEKDQSNNNVHDASGNHNIQNDVYPPYLLSSDEMYQIAVHVLPRNIVYSKWIRLYSLVRDGDSFHNCLRIIQNYKQSLLIIRTTKNYRFGTYVDAPWDTNYSQQHGTINYYGGPETCLFRIDDNHHDSTTNPNSDSDKDTKEMNTTKSTSKVICYRWSGANRYIQLCDPQHKMFAIGGGNGTFGLCIQQDFQYGSTGTCTTFYNEPLCPDEQFHILNLEIYGFLLGQF